MRTWVMMGLLVLVTSCGTPYQKSGFAGGYTDRLVAGGTHLIRVKVNAYTSASTAYDYFHRRAEELCPLGYQVLDYDPRTEVRKPEVFGRVQCNKR